MGIIKAPAGGGKSVPLEEITATAEQILTGFFGMSDEGIIIPGVMPNNGFNGNTQELNTLLGVSGTYTDQYYVKGFPKGYYGAPEISDDQNVIYFDKALTGNAIASDIVSGKTATSANGLKMSGTLVLSGNAATSQVLSGKTFYTTNPKSRLTGTMPSQGAVTYTPRTYNQTLAAGRYLSGAVTVLGDADLVAANIKKDKNIFGITGTWEGYVLSEYNKYLYKYYNQNTAGLYVQNTQNCHGLNGIEFNNNIRYGMDGVYNATCILKSNRTYDLRGATVMKVRVHSSVIIYANTLYFMLDTSWPETSRPTAPQNMSSWGTYGAQVNPVNNFIITVPLEVARFTNRNANAITPFFGMYNTRKQSGEIVVEEIWFE